MQQNAIVYPIRTGFKGWGLAAGEFIKRGTFVMQYFGEVFDTETKLGTERLKKYKGSTCTYLMKIHKTFVIDPTYKGSMARFINHSCDPNCETQKWNVLGEICVGIFAIKDIQEGEELSFDYRFDCYRTPLTRCYCGAKSCKGYLGVMPATMSPEKWEKKLDDMPCMICKKVEDSDDNQMLLCDECNRGYHALCLNPPLTEIPKEEWFCPECIDKMCPKENVIEEEKVEPPPATLEEIKEMLRDINNQVKNIEPEYKTLLNEAKARIIKEEGKIKLHKLEQNYIGYSKDFLSYYLLQKRIRKIIKADETNSPKKKQLTKDILSDSLKMVKEDNKEADAIVISSEEATSQYQPKGFEEQPVVKPEVMHVDSFQVELEVEVRKLIREQEQPQPMNISPAKERTTISLPNKDFKSFCKCLNSITEIGARLYWDSADGGTVEVQIIGTPAQISIVQRVAKFIQEKIRKDEAEHKLSIYLPKLYLRKILGYQNKNKDQYKQLYDVDISYDQSLIADDVYALSEFTEIILTGPVANTSKVQKIIEAQIRALKVVTIQVSLNDGKYLKESIYSLKTQIDPAELRIKKTTNHTEMKDLNHPFYFIPNYSKDALIIGFNDEVQRAEGIINEFLASRYNGRRVYTLSQLLPLGLQENIKRIRAEFGQQMPSLQMFIYEPNPPRKHITVLLMGTWEEIRNARSYMDRQLERNPGDLDEFQGFVMLQQARFTYKTLKRFLLEDSTRAIKHWDLNSSLFENITTQSEPTRSSEETKERTLADAELRKLALFQMEQETVINILFASGKELLPSLMNEMKISKRNVVEFLGTYLREVMQMYDQSLEESPSMQEIHNEPQTKSRRFSSRSKSRGHRRNFSRSRSRSRSSSGRRHRKHHKHRYNLRRSHRHRYSRERSDDDMGQALGDSMRSSYKSQPYYSSSQRRTETMSGSFKSIAK